MTSWFTEGLLLLLLVFVVIRLGDIRDLLRSGSPAKESSALRLGGIFARMGVVVICAVQLINVAPAIEREALHLGGFSAGMHRVEQEVIAENSRLLTTFRTVEEGMLRLAETNRRLEQLEAAEASESIMTFGPFRGPWRYLGLVAFLLLMTAAFFPAWVHRDN